MIELIAEHGDGFVIVRCIFEGEEFIGAPYKTFIGALSYMATMLIG